MKTIICCVRHGQTDGNKSRTFQGRSNLPLNEIGKSQAYSTGNLLKETPLNWDVIISSPFKRALETCEIIKSIIKSPIPIITDELAIERNFGDAEGLPISEENYLKISQNYFTNQESEQDIINRGKLFIDKILKTYKGKNILIVSHSHFIKSLLIPHDNTLKFDSGIPNASLNFLIYNNIIFEDMSLNPDQQKINQICQKRTN